MFSPDAIVFCLSQQHLSGRREKQLFSQIEDLSPLPAKVARLEGLGTNLGQCLDELAEAGRNAILVQPLGLPFSQSLATWLPGMLAHWRVERGQDAPEVALGSETLTDAGLAATIDAVLATPPISIESQKPSLGKPGWDKLPEFTHHILVCTGPRCHYRGAPNLALALNQSLLDAGVRSDCLIATTGCLYPCNQGPLLALYPRAEWYRLPDDTSVEQFVETVIVRGETAPHLLFHALKERPHPHIQQRRIS